MKIVKGQFTPIPNNYSQDLKSLIGLLLLKDYKKRPSIVEILNLSIMKQRMQLYGYQESDHLLAATAVGAQNVFKAHSQPPAEPSKASAVDKDVFGKNAANLDKRKFQQIPSMPQKDQFKPAFVDLKKDKIAEAVQILNNQKVVSPEN